MTAATALLENPLQETSRENKTADPCILVIFGATGDLTGRKLIPALYNLTAEGQLPSQFACVGFARRPKSNEDFRNEMKEAVNKYSRTKPIDENIWKAFADKLFYHRSEFDNDEGYEKLGQFLTSLDRQLGTKGNRVYYLSTQPSYFPSIIQKLGQHKLLYDAETVKDKWSRVIIEKPFGHDLKSAEDLQRKITQYLDESQIYRIDHYLGKETVQNLLLFRFSNPIFEAIWNSNYIEQVQITVAEELGIGTRGHFFEEAGILRDIVQNHMMQLLSIVAMEPPSQMNATSIRNEKVKVLDSIRPIPAGQENDWIVRGQYGPGYIQGEEVPGYREEKDVPPTSNVETFAALRLYIDNWRWGGVPFYLRAGKRLPKRATEIAITFKRTPTRLLEHTDTRNDPNVLVVRIQPDEGISLKINCKIPGMQAPLQPVKMDFRYGAFFGATPPEAYERLICDCLIGDNTLFARFDEVIASWKIFTPILEYWAKTEPVPPFPNYAAGTWGPLAAEALITRDGHKWRLI